MNLKKINKLPKKYTKNKQEKEWLKILSQRTEMIFEIWDERNKYKKLFFVSLFFLFVKDFVILYLADKASNNMKIVWTRVEKDTGAPIGTSVIRGSNMKPEENEIKYFLSKFILDTRTVPLDRNYYNNKIQEQRYFLTNASQEKLNNTIRNDGIVLMFKESRTSTARIVSVNKITNSNDTYQVRWVEEIFGVSGEKNEARNFIGVFTIDFANLKKEEEILKNPLGIIIKDFSFSRENN